MGDGTITIPNSWLHVVTFLVNNDQLTKFNKEFNCHPLPNR